MADGPQPFEIAQVFPEDLKDAVHSGKVVPFAGAGVSMAVRKQGETTPAYPNWKDFLLRAADRLERARASSEANLVRSLVAAKPPDFYQAAQRAQRGLGEREWVKFLRQQFELDHEGIEPETLDLARALWALAPNLIITSNFDLSLRWACPRAQNLREWGLDDPHGYVELLDNGYLDHPAVWHCHGMIHRPQDLALAVDGYEKLYTPQMADAEKRWVSALDTLAHVLVTRTLLFVGFSFTDDYFSNELALISKLYKGASRTHYVLVRRADQEAQEARLAAKFPNGCIRCVPYTDHGKPLIDLLQHLATFHGAGRTPGSTPPTGNGDAPPTHQPEPVDSVEPDAIPRAGESTPIAPSIVERARAEIDAMLLLGAWTPSSDHDRKAVAELGAHVAALERICTELVALPDPSVRYDPNRSEVRHFTWTHPDRIWPVLVGRLPPTVLSKFSEVALEVLTERNPALEMTKEERFLAVVQGKVLGFSGPIREGITKSLVRLANSDDLLKPTHGTSRGSLLAHAVVYKVLEPEWRVWASLDSLLPFLAEAAPSAFIDRVEASLAQNDRGVPHLLAEETAYGASLHTGLLSALETVGWLSDMVPRVALVLARLAARDPGGQLANRPSRSLAGLLHPLLPQSNTTAQERIAVLKLVMDREPGIGWKLGADLIDGVVGPGGFMSPSRRPQLAKWSVPEESKHYARDAKEQVIEQLDLLIARAGDDQSRWIALLNPLWRMPVEFSKRVLSALRKDAPPEHDLIWSKLRELLHDGYEFGGTWKISEDILKRVDEIYRQLTPDDFVKRLAWMFAPGRHVPERVEDGWQGQETRLAELRAEAVADIWKRDDRWELLGRFAEEVEGDWKLGLALAEASFADEVEERVLVAPTPALSKVLPPFAVRRYAAKGFDWVQGLVGALIDANRADEASLVLASLPPSTLVWDLVDSYSDQIRNEYWRKIGGVYGEFSPDETQRAISGLVSVGRLNVALDVASMAKDKLQPVAALNLLEALAAAPEPERTRLVRGGSAGFHLERVFEAVDRISEVPLQRVLELEVIFLAFLEHTSRGAKYLHSALANQPQFFADSISAVYKANSAPASENVDSDEERKRKHAWGVAYRVLESWNGYPGQDKAGDERELDAITWAKEVLRLTTSVDRAEIGAHEVGKVLARMPAASIDGLWPSVAAREILKQDSTTKVGSGLYIEKFNSRGVTTRALGEGGDQERKLAAGFRESAAKLRIQSPEAAAVLDRLAESYEHHADHEDAEAAADRHRYNIHDTKSGSTD